MKTTGKYICETVTKFRFRFNDDQKTIKVNNIYFTVAAHLNKQDYRLQNVLKNQKRCQRISIFHANSDTNIRISVMTGYRNVTLVKIWSDNEIIKTKAKQFLTTGAVVSSQLLQCIRIKLKRLTLSLPVIKKKSIL